MQTALNKTAHGVNSLTKNNLALLSRQQLEGLNRQHIFNKDIKEVLAD